MADQTLSTDTMRKPRRWFAFRLRTLLVAFVVASIPLAWVACTLEWIRERNRHVDGPVGPPMRWNSAKHLDWWVCEPGMYRGSYVIKQLPFSLRCLNAQHFIELYYHGPNEHLAEARRLYPDAYVTKVDARSSKER